MLSASSVLVVDLVPAITGAARWPGYCRYRGPFKCSGVISMSDVSQRRMRMHALSAATAVAVSSLVAGSAFAADRVELHGLDMQQVNGSQPIGVDRASDRHASMLGLGSESRLVELNQTRSNGALNYRYQQTFRGTRSSVSTDRQRTGRGRAHLVRSHGDRPGRRVAGNLAEAVQEPGDGHCQARWPGRKPDGAADEERRQPPDDLCRRRRACPYGVRGVVLRRFGARRFADASDGDRRCQYRQGPQEVGKPAARQCHRPGRQQQDGQYEYGNDLVQQRGAEWQYLHHEQQQRQVGEPQPRYQRQHRVFVHLPAQHLQGHQRRVLADQRRALLRWRHLRHVQQLCRRPAADLPADDEGALQQPVRECVLGWFRHDLWRRRNTRSTRLVSLDVSAHEARTVTPSSSRA